MGNDFVFNGVDCIGGSNGVTRNESPPNRDQNSFIFMQFSARN